MLAALAGAIGMWLMLPRAAARGRMLGVLLGAVSLGMLAWQVPRLGDWLAGGVFYVLAGVTVTAAVATVTLRNPVYAAIWFGLSLLGTAGLFLFQGAQFLAVATVLVYAGAILVTCLFVLMSAQPEGRAPHDRVSWEALVSAFSGALLVGILSMTVTGVLADSDGPGPPVALAPADRSVEIPAEEPVTLLGSELFGGYLIAVEVAGTLLLAALVGAGVIVGSVRGPRVGPDGDESATDEAGKKARSPDA